MTPSKGGYFQIPSVLMREKQDRQSATVRTLPTVKQPITVHRLVHHPHVHPRIRQSEKLAQLGQSGAIVVLRLLMGDGAKPNRRRQMLGNRALIERLACPAPRRRCTAHLARRRPMSKRVSYDRRAHPEHRKQNEQQQFSHPETIARPATAWKGALDHRLQGVSGRRQIRRQKPEHRVIEPPAIAKLRLSQNAFEPKSEPPNHEQRSVIVRRSRDAHPVRPHLMEREIERRPRGLGHETASCRLFAQPIPELAGAMQMNAGLESHDADQRARRALAHREAHRAPGVPIRGAGVGEALVGGGIGIEWDPGQPFAEVSARTVDRLPELGSVARLDRSQHEAGRLDGMNANFTARGNDEHGRTRAVHEMGRV